MDTAEEDTVIRSKEEKVHEEKQEKTDIKKLLAVIPPPNTVLSKQKKAVKEKRVRLLYDPSLNRDEAKVSNTLADELGIKDYLEISVAGRKKFKFKAMVVEGLSNDVVYVNPELMKMHGVADKSICTVRSA